MGGFTYNADYIEYLEIHKASDNSWADTIDEVQPINLAAIETAKLVNAPEPATASLSLLGLAALMMRRRRA